MMEDILDIEMEETLNGQYEWQVVFKNAHLANDTVEADEASVDENGIKFYLKGGLLVYFAPYELIESVYLDRKGNQPVCLVS